MTCTVVWSDAEITRTCGTLAVWLVCMLAHWGAMAWVYHWNVRIRRWPDAMHALPDLLHQSAAVANALQKHRIWIEILFQVYVAAAGAVLAAKCNSAALDSLRMLLVSHGVLLLLRSALFSCTLVPDASGTCHIRAAFWSGGCSDLIFSGHAMLGTLVLLTMLNRAWFANAALNAAASAMFGALWIATSLLAIVSRNHYTVDVVCAWIVTVLYHACATHHPWWQWQRTLTQSTQM